MRPALLLLLVALAVPAAAQTPTTPAAPPAQPVNFAVPAAAAHDVASIDAMIKTLYEVISGPAGEARDWNRLRSLFVPEAKMMPVGVRADESAGLRMLRVNDYVALSGPLLVERGFRETELARRTEQFGHIAHVFSTYEGKVEGGAVPMRGINSIQLMHDGRRWWIVSLAWAPETTSQPLPTQLLSSPTPNQ